MTQSEQHLPAWIRRFPRGLRLASAWIALLMTVVLVLPLAATGLYYLLGVDSCTQHPDNALPWFCSANGRLLLIAVVIPVVLLPTMAWARFLQRVINYRDSQADSSGPTVAARALGEQSQPLSFGQRFRSATLISCTPTSHSVVIGQGTLTFWSVYPLRVGRLKQGDHVYVVYQTVPGSQSLKFALAYSTAASDQVWGVAPVAHSWALGLMIAVVCWFWLGPKPFPTLAYVAAAGALFNLLYLVLVLKAKTALTRLRQQPQIQGTS